MKTLTFYCILLFIITTSCSGSDPAKKYLGCWSVVGDNCKIAVEIEKNDESYLFTIEGEDKFAGIFEDGLLKLSYGGVKHPIIYDNKTGHLLWPDAKEFEKKASYKKNNLNGKWQLTSGMQGKSILEIRKINDKIIIIGVGVT